jgi:hypothetical protein
MILYSLVDRCWTFWRIELPPFSVLDKEQLHAKFWYRSVKLCCSVGQLVGWCSSCDFMHISFCSRETRCLHFEVYCSGIWLSFIGRLRKAFALTHERWKESCKYAPMRMVARKTASYRVMLCLVTGGSYSYENRRPFSGTHFCPMRLNGIMMKKTV